ncbi:MAG: Rossmann-like and DUF2520 domain-containing protein [Candidatus Acidiferrales bacterium]
MPKTLSIIGAGRVGRALGRALRERGWRIATVVTRSRATARAAVRAIGAGTPGTANTPALAADVILIAAPDRAIAQIANQIVGAAPSGRPISAHRRRQPGRHGGLPLRNKAVLHTSGSLSHEVLAPLRAQGAAIAAMHPMQTFGRGARTRLDGVVFGLDGDARAVRVAQQIVRSLGGIPVRVKPQRKATYHLSGGFAAQHLLAVLEAGVRILMDAGLTRRQSTQALASMAHQTIANWQRLGPHQAWTGPVPRGDFATVAKHMAALRRFPREYRQAYIALTRLAARMLAPNPRKLLRELDRVMQSGRKS